MGRSHKIRAGTLAKHSCAGCALHKGVVSRAGYIMHMVDSYIMTEIQCLEEKELYLTCTDLSPGLGAGYPDMGFKPRQSYPRLENAHNLSLYCPSSKYVKPHTVVPILQIRPLRLREARQLACCLHTALYQLQNSLLAVQTPLAATMKPGMHSWPHRCAQCCPLSGLESGVRKGAPPLSLPPSPGASPLSPPHTSLVKWNRRSQLPGGCSLVGVRGEVGCD